MRWRRTKAVGTGALAAGLLTAAAWAQGPGPLPLAGLPATSPGPVTAAPQRPRTWKRAFHDTFVGRPELFAEPPLGYYVNNHFAVMKTKADSHKFTLYRTDFLDGTNAFSPIGATRFNLMAARLPGWLGPIAIEWSPDQPGLAESRRAAVLAALNGAGLSVIPERVVAGPSPYPGTLGVDAANYYNVMIVRDQAAPASLAPSPVSSSGFSLGGGGGSP